jgi:agmatine/peptidylarginine deiminase
MASISCPFHGASMRKISACFVLLCVVTLSCGAPDEGEPNLLKKSNAVQTVKMLPKWKSEEEKSNPELAVLGNSIRASSSQYYALTVPPQSRNFRMMTEWEQMTGVLLAVPGNMGQSVNNSIADMVVNGAAYVDFYIVVPDSSTASWFSGVLRNRGMSDSLISQKVHFINATLDSIWMIDFGPFPVISEDDRVAFVDFRYYSERVNDDAIPTKLGTYFGTTTYRAGLNFEGGNLQMDEVGTCYTSQGVYQENPSMTASQIERVFTTYLGCKKLIVMEPLEDGTAHIDMFMKVVGKNKVILGQATTSTATSRTVQTLEHDAEILSGATAADGTPITVYRIPMPYQRDGVWRTYTNSTMANGVNLWPVYSVSSSLQQQAANVWQSALPSWTHIPIMSDEIITWGGAMHCISRTIPAKTYKKWVPDGRCVSGKCQAVPGGYDGSCSTSADCYGPKWLCSNAYCAWPNDCGSLTSVGCCDGQVVRYCANGIANAIDCTSLPSCGWDSSSSFYDCLTSGGSDPSGTYPKSCSGSCVPNCAGKECGDDGCGGQCPPGCSGTQVCSNGKCVEQWPPQCLGDTGPSADTCPNGLTDIGCCDNGRLLYCWENHLWCMDCAADGYVCGWYRGDNQYPAGYYCGPQSILLPSDPSRQYPPDCPKPCVPNCAGKQCGDDGCGGSCGTCPSGKTCQNYQCVGCTPNCAGKECGDDGCGGSCGACPSGYDCSTTGKCIPWCTRDCTNKECGDDNCGGSCGTCPSGKTCQNYQCVEICVPNCAGKECGDNGCGGSCGECKPGYTCDGFYCKLAGSQDATQADISVDSQTGDIPSSGNSNNKGGGCSATNSGSAVWLLCLVIYGISVYWRQSEA